MIGCTQAVETLVMCAEVRVTRGTAVQRLEESPTVSIDTYALDANNMHHLSSWIRREMIMYAWTRIKILIGVMNAQTSPHVKWSVYTCCV